MGSFKSIVDHFSCSFSFTGLLLGRLSSYKGIDVFLKSLPLVDYAIIGYVIAERSMGPCLTIYF